MTKSKPVVRQASFSLLKLATLLRSVKTYVGLQAFIYMPDTIQLLDFIRLAESCFSVYRHTGYVKSIGLDPAKVA